MFGLIDGKVEAAARSKRSGKTVYMVQTPDGEFLLSDVPLKGVVLRYTAGNEVALTDEDKQKAHDIKTVKKAKVQKESYTSPAAEEIADEEVPAEIKQVSKPKRKVAKQAVKKTAPKKVAKKAAPKKAAKKVVKKEPKEERILRGNNMFLSKAVWKKVDAKVEASGLNFSAWVREAVMDKLK